MQVSLRVPNSFHPLAFLPSFLPRPFFPSIKGKQARRRGVRVRAFVGATRKDPKRGDLSHFYPSEREEFFSLKRLILKKAPINKLSQL